MAEPTTEQAPVGQLDVSVIVIGHNVADELVSCLESVCQHRGGVEVEVIFVDNGSTDGSADLIARRFPSIQVVRRPTNEGLPARNHGLRRAQGRYRMFLDSDAELTDGALPALVEALDAQPHIGLVGPRLTYPDGTLQLSTRRYPPLAQPFFSLPGLKHLFGDGRTVRRYLMADDLHDRQRRVEYLLGACQLFRAEAQRGVGEIDERIWFGHDDADWCFRIREAGFDILYLPEVRVVHHYRRTASSAPLSIFALRFLLAHLHFQRKWWSRRRRLKDEGRAMDREAMSGGAPGEADSGVEMATPTADSSPC